MSKSKTKADSTVYFNGQLIGVVVGELEMILPPACTCPGCEKKREQAASEQAFAA